MQQADWHTGVTVIGAGERGIYFVGSRIAEAVHESGLRIVGVHDRLPERAALAAEHINGIYAAAGIDHRVRVFETMDEAIDFPMTRLVVVTTHTDNHRVPVEKAVAAGKRVYLDKPISVSPEDAELNAAAEASSGQPIMMGFTRRYERPWVEAVNIAHGGRIGTPRMVLLRSVIPYWRYLQLWHRNQSRSGGALNDKGSHHFDVLNWLASGAVAKTVVAVGGRSGIFKPDPDMPARCRECARDCPYRRHETLIDKFEGVSRVPNRSWVTASNIDDRNDTCVFSPGADIDDHAVITIQYENGLVATLFFTIFGPWAEDQETLEVVGDSGRLRMERHSGTIDLVENYGHTRSRIGFPDPDRNSSHYGADRELVRRMQRFVAGEKPPVGVAEGVASLRLVRAAQKSLENGSKPFDPFSEGL